MDMQAIVTRDQEKFNFETVHLKELGPNEVLVRIVASGVCHTDSTILDGTVNMHKPVVLGHEGSGIVEKVGSEVTTLKVNDHVVIGFASCGHCEHCLSGVSAACDEFPALNMVGKNRNGEYVMHSEHNEGVSQFFGQSSFAQYTVIHESSAVKVDTHFDLRYLGPLGCGFMTGAGSVFNVIKPEYGTSIVIFGTGAVGLSALMAAAIVGCSQIIAVDINDDRLELAKKMGATHVINSTKEDPIKTIQTLTNGGAHNSFETTGVGAVGLQAIRCLRHYGKMFPVAVSNAKIELDLTPDVVIRSITIRGIMEGDANPKLFIPKILAFWEQGRFPFDQLIQFYKSEDIAQAFEDSKTGKVIKPVLVFDETYKPKK